MLRFSSFLKDTRPLSKSEALDFARQTFVPDNYRCLEQSVEQGYELQIGHSDFVISRTFQDWCKAFGHSCIGVHLNGSIHILCRTQTPSEDQINELRHLEWGKFALMKGCVYIRLPGNAYEGPVGPVIQDALDILGLPFVTGLPTLAPVKSRYERLMTDSSV